MSVDTPIGEVPAEASFRRGWQEVLAGQTRPVSELWEGIAPTPTPETQQALEDAQTRQNLASFADPEELFEDLAIVQNAPDHYTMYACVKRLADTLQNAINWHGGVV